MSAPIRYGVIWSSGDDTLPDDALVTYGADDGHTYDVTLAEYRAHDFTSATHSHMCHCDRRVCVNTLSQAVMPAPRKRNRKRRKR